MRTDENPGDGAARRRRRRTARAFLLASVFGWMMIGGPGVPGTGTAVRAQEEPSVRSVARPGEDREADAKDQVQRRRLTMDEVEILGEVEKPKTMFVIPRAPHQYAWEHSRTDFTEDILAPISLRELEGMQRWGENAALR